MSTPTRAVPARALVVGAHPEDVDFSAGGLVAKVRACSAHDTA